MNPTLLLLEDDPSLIDGLQYALVKNGFAVEVARSVKEAGVYLSGRTYDLLLLDVALPDGSGFEVCGRLRQQGSRVPIIFLTAADEEVNVIRGLDMGGDDYMTKPFKLGELCSRIKALLRRSGRFGLDGADSVLESGNVRIDLLGSRVTLLGEPVELTGVEYRLLCLLVRNTGRVVSRSLILDNLWDGTGDYVDDNTLSVYIRRLREKLEGDPSHPERLVTVRGFGYQWNEVRP